MSTQAPEGVALDEAVAAALGAEPGAAYSSDWRHGGPIIEREKISILPPGFGGESHWEAGIGARNTYDGWDADHAATGSTALIAAMRAYVASKV